MKRKVCIIVLTLIALTSLVACGSEDNEPNSTKTQSASSQTQMYYDKNEAINLYINNYNNANPDSIIEQGMFETYNHHGQDHDDQIIMQCEGFEVVMSDNVYFEVVVSGDADQNSYYEMFKKYAKGYDETLTDEVLEEYWTQLMNDAINAVEFERFECSLRVYNDEIELMQLSGTIS